MYGDANLRLEADGITIADAIATVAVAFLGTVDDHMSLTLTTRGPTFIPIVPSMRSISLGAFFSVVRSHVELFRYIPA